MVYNIGGSFPYLLRGAKLNNPKRSKCVKTSSCFCIDADIYMNRKVTLQVQQKIQSISIISLIDYCQTESGIQTICYLYT